MPQTKSVQFQRRRPISIRSGARRWLRSAPGWRGGAPGWAPPPGRSLWAAARLNRAKVRRGSWPPAWGAPAGALAVGRFAPHLLDVAPWPYILLGCGYASLAIGLAIVGAQRQRELERALRTGDHIPLRFRTVAVFTVGGVALAVMTVVLVIAQT